MSRGRYKLGVRLSAGVLTITVALVLVIIVLGFWFTRQEELQGIEDTIAAIRSQHVDDVSLAVWDLDDDRIASELRGILHMDHVVWAEANDGLNKYRQANPGRHPEPETSREVRFPLTHDTEGTFGSLTVAFDHAALEAAIWRQAWIRLLATTVPILTLALSLLVLFHRLVTSHLQRLAEQLRNLHIDKLDTPFVLNRPHREKGDEIDELVTGLDIMRANLRAEIDQRQNVEGRLAESEQNYDEVFNAIGEAVFIHDAETGSVLDVNRTACALYGSDRDTLINAAPNDFSLGEAPYAAEQALEHLRKARESGPQLFIWRAKRASGDHFWAEVHLRASTIGGCSRVLATIRDVTARRSAEEELAQFKKMDSIGQMAGGIAHDFNNMLGGIMGAGEILARRCEGNEELKRFTDIILQACERASDLTSKLLAFSRRGVRDLSSLDIHQVIDDALTIVERSIDRRIEVHRRYEADITGIQADHAGIQNALINLCLNARDAMPDGGVLSVSTDTIRMTEADCTASPFDLQPGPYVQISVTDTGSGMTPGIRRRIFEPFFTTKGIGKGTGMGLAAVYGIVTDHRGSVTVYSEPGHGTAFHILLPADPAVIPADREEQYRDPPSGQGTILLIEDEELVRQSTAHMLEDLGYKVLIAEDGQEGAELFADHQERIDLVLLDMIMPRLNGADCFKRIRACDSTAKVLMCSGFARHELADELLSNGLLGFLRKPLRLFDLATAIDRALRGKRPSTGRNPRVRQIVP